MNILRLDFKQNTSVSGEIVGEKNEGENLHESSLMLISAMYFSKETIA